jgi:hypothetical protein
MKTHTHVLKLETDYTKNGNSTGEQVNTLSIALGYGDINEIEENNMEWTDSAEQYALNEWLGDDSNFDATLSKEDAKKYSEDLKAYNDAREEWVDGIRDTAWELPEDHPVRVEMYKARDSAYDDMRREWLFGDRSSHGVLGEARKQYCDGDMEIEYDDKDGAITVSFSDDDIASAFDDGRIAEKSASEFVYWLECAINNDAERAYQKRKREGEARRAQYEKTRVYQEDMKKAREEAKREKLRKLAA